MGWQDFLASYSALFYQYYLGVGDIDVVRTLEAHTASRVQRQLETEEEKRLKAAPKKDDIADLHGQLQGLACELQDIDHRIDAASAYDKDVLLMKRQTLQAQYVVLRDYTETTSNVIMDAMAVNYQEAIKKIMEAHPTVEKVSEEFVRDQRTRVDNLKYNQDVTGVQARTMHAAATRNNYYLTNVPAPSLLLGPTRDPNQACRVSDAVAADLSVLEKKKTPAV